MRAAAQHAPAAFTNQQRHHHAGEQIRPIPAKRFNQNARDYGGNRAEQVAQHVQKRAVHIQIIALAAQHQPCHADVYQQAEHGNHQHGGAGYGNGAKRADDGFQHNPPCHHHQR